MLVLIQPSLQMFDFSLPSYNLPEYSNMDKQSMIYSWLMYGFGKKDKYSHFVRKSHVTLEARQRYTKLLDFDTLDKKYYDQDYKRPDPPAGDDGVWNAIKELVLDPYFAPGMAENLSSIPETYIMTAGRDPLRDEGVIFAQRLVDSGVAGVGHEHHQDMVHGQAHYELPMEKKVPWNGAVSMRSRAGSWETLSIYITLRHKQGAPADMHANALGILIICRFPLA